MTRPGYLDNSRVRHWLGDIEPAWTALTDESFNALHAEPSATNTALRLANDLTADELDASAVARNTACSAASRGRRRRPEAERRSAISPARSSPK